MRSNRVVRDAAVCRPAGNRDVLRGQNRLPRSQHHLLLRLLWTADGVRRNVLPVSLRNEEGEANLLVRRVPGILSADAELSVSSRMLRVSSAPLRASKMCEETGEERVPGRCSGLQMRRSASLSRLPPTSAGKRCQRPEERLRLPPSFQQRHRRRFRRRQRRRHPPQDRRSEPHVLVRCGVEPAVLLVARSPIPGQREPLPRKPRQRGRLAFCRREDRAVVSLLLRAGRQTGRPPCFRRFHPSSTSLTRSVPVYHWTVAPGVRIIDVGCAADAVATRKRIPDANHYPT